MKIIHICLSNFYIDNFSYQENEIVSRNVQEGHDVLVVASTESYDDNKIICYVEPGDYKGSDGARVIRLPYRKYLPEKIMRKVRMHDDVYSILNDFSPDVILFHGMCGWELLTVTKYKINHPEVKFYVDSHADEINSASSWFSKYFLHCLFYKPIVHRCLQHIEKILCVSQSVVDFSHDFYRIPAHKLEFFPLGGEIPSDSEYMAARLRMREMYSIKDGDLLFVQSGKFDTKKKLAESLRAFSSIDNQKLRLLIAGHLSDEVRNEVLELIDKDPRVKFLGWNTPDQLRDLLCAADVYLQPGSQSATMQMSLCTRCIVILDDVNSHKPYLSENGWLIGKSLSLRESIALAASLSEYEVASMADKSYGLARDILDYRVLANRICR